MGVLEVTLSDFAAAFGTTIEGLPQECKDFIAKTDFKYTILEGEDRDRIILQVLNRIASDTQIVGAKERKEVWEHGWSENFSEFAQSGYNPDKLIPKFIRPNQAIRFNQNYIIPSNPYFEWNFFSVLRLWLFKKLFSDCDSIYEFGCGTGHNLIVLAKLYPQKKLYGLDYAVSAVEIITKLTQANQWNMQGAVFDMFSPDEKFKIEKKSAVFTIGTIEQLAGRFEPFLQFLLKRAPRICVHVEPIFELYDENSLVDYLAIQFHKKRGYTQDYLTRLRELEKKEKLRILKAKRLFMGSLYMEGYSVVVWRPKP